MIPIFNHYFIWPSSMSLWTSGIINCLTYTGWSFFKSVLCSKLIVCPYLACPCWTHHGVCIIGLHTGTYFNRKIDFSLSKKFGLILLWQFCILWDFDFSHIWIDFRYFVKVLILHIIYVSNVWTSHTCDIFIPYFEELSQFDFGHLDF
jgi:hypothetical protein